jgi:hypothetical protein
MAGICSKAAIVLVVALVLVSSASAASPDVRAMNLQATDVPGAKITGQNVKEKGYLSAYLRTFKFAAPRGGARLLGIEAETRLAVSASKPTSDAATVEKQFRSSAGRKRLVAEFAASVQVPPKAVVIGVPRKLPGFDQGFEAPVSLGLRGGRIYETFAYLRLDRVFVIMVEVGLRPITAAVTAKYATAIGSHIGTELTPKAVAPPTIAGTAVQGQTLTAAPGTWSAPEASFNYQWQHCDAAGANCADVAGATAQTYAVTAADVGTTLVVVVTAANRFGSPTAPSVATAVVS